MPSFEDISNDPGEIKGTDIEETPKTKILVVDDDRLALQMSLRILNRAGMEVDTAENGLVALKKLQAEDYAILITDWMMPEMDGPELVEKIQARSSKNFMYIIMLTSKTETGDIVRGLEIGADDYLTKPFQKEELLARVEAGKRVWNLNHRLQFANQKLEALNNDLEKANDAMRKDLDAARRAQESLLPKAFPEVPGIQFGARMIPSAFVAGDIYNIFKLDDAHIGFYQVDVSGHGVPSSLFSVSLSQILTQDLHRHGLLLAPYSGQLTYRINPPGRVIEILNEANMLEKHGHYFTMLYAILNTFTGELVFSRAGHNMPLLLHRDGVSEYIKDGAGAPVGLAIPREDDEEYTVRLKPGDAFIIFSDGITDAGISGKRMGEYGFERVRNLLSAHAADTLDASMQALIDDLKRYVEQETGRVVDSFEDDVSIIGIRWRP